MADKRLERLRKVSADSPLPLAAHHRQITWVAQVVRFIGSATVLAILCLAGCWLDGSDVQDSGQPIPDFSTPALSVVIQGEGSVSPNGGQFELGTSVTLSATPAPGWRFDGWSGGADGTDNPLELTVTQDITVTAMFVQVHGITINVIGGGAVSFSPDQVLFDADSQVLVTAISSDGWRFDRWAGDVASVDSTINLVMDSDKRLTALFIQQFSVSVEINGEGDVSLDPQRGVYDAGTTITFNAIPADKWSFDHWEGDLEGVNETEQVTLQSDLNIVAVFEPDNVTVPDSGPGGPGPPSPDPTTLLNIATIGRGEVTVSPQGTDVPVEDGRAWLYAPDTSVALTALDQPGGCFFRWRGDVDSTERAIQVSINDSVFVLAEFVDPAGPPPAPTLSPVVSPTSASSVVISGSIAACQNDVISVVEIAGPSGIANVPVNGGSFTADIPLSQNRTNALLVTAISKAGVRGAPATIQITHDVEAPELFIDFPSAGGNVTTDTIDVAGRVSDVLSGFLGLSVDVNNIAAHVDAGIGTNGTFFRDAVPLQLGLNLITVVATDELGNQVERSVTVTRRDVEVGEYRLDMVSGDGLAAQVNEMLPEPIVVRVRAGDGTPFANKVVTFHVTRSDGRLSATAGEHGEMTVQIHTDAEGLASAHWRLGSDAGKGNNRVEVTSTSIQGTTIFCASALSRPASQINISMGNNQGAEVGAPLPAPLSVWVSDGRNGVGGVPITFTVLNGGGRVNDRREVVVNSSATGHARVDFELGTGPGHHVVEASISGNSGPPARFVAYGIQRDISQDTSFSGLVLDNAGRPLQGATCTLVVGGVALPSVESLLDGRFHFDGISASGRSDLFLDGSAVFHAGGAEGSSVLLGTFPRLHYETVIVPNAENSLPTPVFLPPLDPNNEVAFDNSQDVELTVDGIDGLKMIVRAGSMTRADGSVPSPSDPATLSLNQVHFDEVPMPFPDGAAPPFAWTLQPGGSHFDPPVEIELPNMSGLAPGAIVYLLSFNHDTNRFEIVASGQVSDDGLVIRSDAGSGISTAGWGGNCPPYPSTGSIENCLHIEAEKVQGGAVPYGDYLCKNQRQQIIFDAALDAGSSAQCGIGPIVWRVSPSSAGSFPSGNTGSQVRFLQADDFVSTGVNDVVITARLSDSSARFKLTVFHVNSSSGVLATGQKAIFKSDYAPVDTDVTRITALLNEFIINSGHKTREYAPGVRPETQTEVFDVINLMQFKRRNGELWVEVFGGSTPGDVYVTMEAGFLLLHAEHMTVVDLEILEVWSDQHPGVTANRLPGQSGRIGADYLLVGHRADSQVHVKANLELDPDTEFARDNLLVRLALSDGSSSSASLDPVGMGTLATTGGPPWEASMSNGTESSLIQTDPVLYKVVAGYDGDADGKLSETEIGTVFQDGMSHLKIVEQAISMNNQLYLSGLVVGGWASFPLASLHVALFLGLPLDQALDLITEQRVGRPTETAASVSVNELDHNVGVLFSAPQGSATISKYIYDSSSPLAQDIVDADGFRSDLNLALLTNRQEVLSYFATFPGETNHQFSWTFGHTSPGGLDRSVDFGGFSDLHFAIGGATMNATLTVDVRASDLSVTSVLIQGQLTDTYDWNFDQFGTDARAATVQTGFDTLPALTNGADAPGGVFKLQVELNHEVENFSYAWSP